MYACNVEKAIDLIVFHDELTRLFSRFSDSVFAGIVETLSEEAISCYVTGGNVITIPLESIEASPTGRYRLVRREENLTARQQSLSEEFPYTHNLVLLDVGSGEKITLETEAAKVPVDGSELRRCLANQIV